MRSGTGDATARDDRVLPVTRAVAAIIVPFLVVAFFVLYPWPTDTGRLFAWQIKPTMTPMVLGSAYLGGAYYFVCAARATAWHTIKGGLVPVGVFASLMGVATIIHWDRFLHGHVAFRLWAFLYFTTPFLVFWVYWRNRRHDAPTRDDDRLLPVTAARVIAAVGALALLTGAFLFLLPQRAIAIWPWTLTPLTARVMGAVFCLGLAGLGTLFDRRWSAARLPLRVAAIMLVLILVAAARAHSELDPHNALTWLLLTGFVVLLAGIVVLHRRMRETPTPSDGYGQLTALVTRMREDLRVMTAAGDARRYFHGTYLRTTEAVAAEIARGGFRDGEWLERWDIVFADLYLRALDADRDGGDVPAPWRVAFDAARDRPDLPPLQHVLFGINAHINYDLPQALIAVISPADFDDPDLIASRSADHRRLDTVLSSRVGAEDAELSAVSRVTLRDRLMRPANRAASRRFLAESREKVWRNAVVLDRARRAGDDRYRQVLAELEELSAARVADLVAPGAVLLKLARRGFGVLLPTG